MWCRSTFHNIFRDLRLFLLKQWTCLSKSAKHCKGFVAYCIMWTCFKWRFYFKYVLNRQCICKYRVNSLCQGLGLCQGPVWDCSYLATCEHEGVIWKERWPLPHNMWMQINGWLLSILFYVLQNKQVSVWNHGLVSKCNNIIYCWNSSVAWQRYNQWYLSACRVCHG